MNLSIFGWQREPCHDSELDDDLRSEWLGGEAWVTPQPFAHERRSKPIRLRAEDQANDWVPL